MLSIIQPSFDSKNFFVNLITVLFIALNANDAGIPLDLAPEAYEAIRSGNLTLILVTLLPNLINPITKVFGKPFSWSFLSSQNFIINMATVVLLGVSGLGILFPDNAAQQLIEAIFGKDFQTIAIALVINIVNPIYIWFKNRKAVITTA